MGVKEEVFLVCRIRYAYVSKIENKTCCAMIHETDDSEHVMVDMHSENLPHYYFNPFPKSSIFFPSS